PIQTGPSSQRKPVASRSTLALNNRYFKKLLSRVTTAGSGYRADGTNGALDAGAFESARAGLASAPIARAAEPCRNARRECLSVSRTVDDVVMFVISMAERSVQRSHSRATSVPTTRLTADTRPASTSIRANRVRYQKPSTRMLKPPTRLRSIPRELAKLDLRPGPVP